MLRNLFIILLISTLLFGARGSSKESIKVRLKRFNDQVKMVEELSFLLIYQNEKEAEKNKLQIGKNFLRESDLSLYVNKEKNEFEFDEYKLKYYNMAINNAKKAKKKYMNKEVTFAFTSKLGKYDFEKGIFPVNVRGKKGYRIDNKSIMGLYVNSRYNKKTFSSEGVLLFKNLNLDRIAIKMGKKDAKELVKHNPSRKITTFFTGYIRELKVCQIHDKKNPFPKIKYDYTYLPGRTCFMFDFKSMKFGRGDYLP